VPGAGIGVLGRFFVPQGLWNDLFVGIGRFAGSIGRGSISTALATVVVAGLGLASCSSGPSSTGYVSGGVRLLAGPPAPHTYLLDHQAGTIVVERDGQTVGHTVEVTGHSFRVSVPQGEYLLSARVSGYRCLGENISVQANREVTAEVSCSSVIPYG
jgi:hypothetical protein